MTETSPWMLIRGSEAEVKTELINAALQAAPAAIRDGQSLLPRTRGTSGRCRLCGSSDPLTIEHVPPRSSGNAHRIRMHDVRDWLERESLDELPGGSIEQGGIWGYTLCAACNSGTGRLSDSYRRWAAIAAKLLAELRPISEMNQDHQSKLLGVQIEKTQPGAFVRQVMSLMFSISGDWGLRDNYPELAQAVLDGSACTFPTDLFLGMVLCAGPMALACGPSLIIDAKSQTWRWVVVLAYPPLAFELELARSLPAPRPTPACGIGDFFEVPERAIATVDLSLPLAFTNTAFPGDWRTRAQIELGLDLDGSQSDR